MKTLKFLPLLAGLLFNASLFAAQDHLTDSQILQTVKTVNNGEISLAQLAQRSENADVRNFAKMMIDHHKKSNNEMLDLEKKLHLKPNTSKTSKNLQEEANDTKKDLQRASGTEFNSKYIASQVDMHGKVLDLLDSKLIPAASDSELKTALNKVRSTVSEHLSEAKKIQSQL
ncbi:MAG: DUF4142 domain-containing protein [Deltaproteobacteria bacterium]|nr:DUF4142 domain-containing protein [Deltaproteobacteria bacterium]